MQLPELIHIRWQTWRKRDNLHDLTLDENNIKVDINPLKTKRRLLYLKTQFVPRSKHFSTRL